MAQWSLARSPWIQMGALFLLSLALPGCQQHPRSFHGHVGRLVAAPPPPEASTPGFTPIPEEERVAFEAAAEEPYRLGIGDRVRIQVLDAEATTRYEDGVEVRVKADGTIRLPKAGKVEARDLSALQLEDALTEKFRAIFAKDAVVNIDVTHFKARKFFVVGQVANPGKIAADGQITLLEALLEVGGTNVATADVSEAYVIRGGKPIPFSIRDLVTRGHPAGQMVMAQNDVVFVPHVRDRAEFVYVFGEVAAPKRVPMDRVGPAGESVGRLTLAAAIADAGGLNERADVNTITIYRGKWPCPTFHRLSVCDVYRHGHSVELHPGDRIAVGTSRSASFSDALAPAVQILGATTSTVSLALSAIALDRR